MTEERQSEWRNRRMGDIQVGLILNRERKKNPMTLRFHSRPDEPWKARVMQSIVDEANATGAFYVRRTSMRDTHEIHIYCDAASAKRPMTKTVPAPKVLLNKRRGASTTPPRRTVPPWNWRRNGARPSARMRVSLPRISERARITVASTTFTSRCPRASAGQ